MKKLLISLLVAGVLVGAVYGAAASLSVGGTDNLGSGEVVVTSGSSLSTTDTEWLLDSTDNTLVTGVRLRFDEQLDNGSDIDVQVRDSSCSGGINGQASTTLGATLSADQQTGAAALLFGSPTAASAIDCLEVTVREPA